MKKLGLVLLIVSMISVNLIGCVVNNKVEGSKDEVSKEVNTLVNKENNDETEASEETLKDSENRDEIKEAILKLEKQYREDDGILELIEEKIYNEDKSRIERRLYLWGEEFASAIYIDEYDKNGNIIKEETTEYDKKGNIEDNYYWESTYDEKGNLIKYDRVDDGIRDDIPYMTYDFNYDQNGNKISCMNYCNGEFNARSEYEYDVNGLLVREKIYNSNNVLDSTKEYKYHSNGEIRWYNYTQYRFGEYSEIQEYTYDDKGIESEIIYKFGEYINGEWVIQEDRKYIYEYDKKGNLIKETEYSGKMVVNTEYIYEFNNNGDILNVVCYYSIGDNKKIKYGEEYEYDDNGIMVKYKYFNELGELKNITEFEYYQY